MSLAVPLVEPSVLSDLARARRHRRIENVDVFEVLYRAYILAIIGGVAVLELGGVTDDTTVKGKQLADVSAHGAAALGGLLAAAVCLGLRSATRGGPVTLEAPFVRHVLGSPVPRRLALGQPVFQLMRRFVAAGVVLGAIVGAVAFRRLPGTAVEWIASCALCGAGTGLAVAGAGLLGSGLRISRVPALLVSLVLLGWSALDLWKTTATSPFTLLGEIALWPLHMKVLGLIGLAVAVALGVLGRRLAPGLSLEAAERRSTLVGALRFAATTRDLRAVVVLRRQLTSEAARQRPWIRLDPRPGRGGPRGAVSRRDLHGMLRWPALRWARMVFLAALAAVCMRGVWAGTAPLVVVAALCLWAVALEATEGLAQELDHSDRSFGFPLPSGYIRLRHLLVPCVVMVVLGAIGVVVAAAFGGFTLALEIGGVTLLPAALAAVAGAAVSIIREPAKAGSGLGMAPEMAGTALVVRELLPPLVALTGLIPVLVARAAAHHHQPPFDAAVNIAFLVLLVPIATFGWVHAKDRFASAMDTAKQDALTRPGSGQKVQPSAPARPPVHSGPNRTRSSRGGRR